LETCMGLRNGTLFSDILIIHYAWGPNLCLGPLPLGSVRGHLGRGHQCQK
jgi:hypothetical protein